PNAPYNASTRRQFRAAWFNLTPVAFTGLMFNVRFVILASGSSPVIWDLSTPGNCEYADEVADVIPNTEWINGTIATGPNCCTATASISPAGPTTFCQGGSVTLNANTGTGLSYQWSINGSPITGANSASYVASTSGSYTVAVSSSPNCSATSSPVAVLVKNNSTATIEAAICQGQTYTFGSQSLTSAGTYNRTVTAANGCDSVITLTLAIKPNASSNISAAICQGQTYTFGSQSLSSAGTYNRTVTAANGCDSVITLTLSIKQPATSAVTVTAGTTVCGQVFSTPGTFTKVCPGAAANGCDSIITLTVNPAGPNISTTIGSVSGCVGDTVTVPVTISMASGISTAAISMAIDYDSTKLRCISAVTGLNANIATGFLSNCGLFTSLNPNAPYNASTRRQFRAAWFNLTPVSFNGRMFNVRFVILASGSSPVIWDLSTAGNCEYADEVADVIPNTEWINGTISTNSNCCPSTAG
ncbi:MAG: cohesin domain-containing protein, partial [Bacteroidota bacterium]